MKTENNNRIPPKQRTQDIRRGVRTITTAPTKAPRNFYESMAFYTNGGTKRFYVYDEVSKVWRYVALT